jgi:hypothetical protein
MFKIHERLEAAKSIETEGKSVKHDKIKDIIKDIDSIKKMKESTDQLKKQVIDESIIKEKLKHEQMRQQEIELKKQIKDKQD